MNIVDLGKYKGIVVSVALFLLLDASVLLMNFYISFEIADDAVGVNVAGRQRMLSQRTMKSLLDVQVSGEDTERALTELRNSVKLFDRTLKAFADGGVTSAPGEGDIFIAAVESEAGINAVAEAQRLWRPYKGAIEILLAVPVGSLAFDNSLREAIDYGQEHNLTLLKLMNNLTVDLEQIASSKAITLRLIQTVGISLALINFFIIMFHFLRQLRTSDEKIEAAQQETQEILETVNEGLFLIDEELIIGEQYSRELEAIFGRSNIAHSSFSNLLEDMVSEKDMTTAYEFIELLFKPSIKQNLIGDLNPLNNVEIHLAKPQGGYENKFLRFSFSRVSSTEGITHVLVTVADITEQSKLSKQLEAAKKQNEQQLTLLQSMLGAPSDLLPLFMNNSMIAFDEINTALREPSKSRSQFQQKANHIYTIIHNFKGEAAALELEQFVDAAHEFEDEIALLKSRKEIGGKDFLPVTVLLNNLMSQMESARGLANKLGSLAVSSGTTPKPENAQANWSHLQSLATKIAEKQGKKVEVIHSGLSEHQLSEEQLTSLNGISVQLLRNAIAHGIETETERFDAQKTAVGTVDIRLTSRLDGTLQYTFKDDGEGLNLGKIRNTAIESGLISEIEANALDKKQIISMIFAPDLSTYDSLDEDAGRGIGMSAVKDLSKKLGGRIAISSKPSEGTTFRISFPAVQQTNAKAA